MRHEPLASVRADLAENYFCTRFNLSRCPSLSNARLVDRLAKDIGLSRSELLGEDLHPTSQSLLSPLWTAPDVPRPASRVRLIRSTDA